MNRAEMRQLINSVEREQLVVFLGAGASVGAGIPLWGKIEKFMRDEMDLSESDFSGPRVADLYKSMVGPSEYRKMWDDLIRIKARSEIHEALTKLPIAAYITTNFDTLLEESLKISKREYDVAALEDSEKWKIVNAESKKTWILKIHGCIDREKIITTELDYLNYYLNYEDIANSVARVFENKPVLFIGYSLSDWNLLSVLNLSRKYDGYASQKKYFIGFHIPILFQKYLESNYNMTVFNFLSEVSTDTVCEFLHGISKSIKISDELRLILTRYGFYTQGSNITRHTRLADIQTMVDITQRVRLATYINDRYGDKISLTEIIDEKYTVGDLMADTEL